MSERVESLGHFEMLWTCDHCDTTGLLGKSQRHCPNCGAKQNPDKRYFPEPGSAQRAQGHQFEGADVKCQNCDAPMGAKAKNCANCGAPLDAARAVKEILGKLEAPVRKGRNWRRTLIILGVIAAVIFGIWFLFIRTKSEHLSVTAHRWENTIDIARFDNYRGEAWDDQVPARADRGSCVRKKRSSRRVDTGREECRTERKDKRDGTFEEIKKCKPIYTDEDVDGNWCSYRIAEWRYATAVTERGSGLDPKWPATKVPASAPESIGSEKQSTRHEKRFVDFGAQTCEVPEAKWRALKDGQKVNVQVRARSGAIVCDSF